MKTIAEIKQQFLELPGLVREQLLNELLQDFETRGQVLENVTKEREKSNNRKDCPHCSSTSVYKRGKQHGVQMYKCRSCSKWFSETTGTPLWDIKLKHKWQGYLRCMEQGMSIKKIAKELEISIQTSFDWRHKVLSSLSGFTPESLSDVLSADEITQALDGKLADQTTLITDKHPSYKLFARENPALRHKSVLGKEHVNKNDKNIHLQHVNSTHSQLRIFLSPFNGVSSKYLQNYLNWFAYAGKLSGTKTTIKMWLINILASAQAYELFRLFKENAVNIRT